MKYLFIICLSIGIYSCKTETKKTEIKKQPITTFNDSLAKKFGADKYGMKKYVMAFLKKGPNRDQDSITKVKLQSAHMENINKLANDGKLVLAGPFFGKDDLRGIYIFDVTTIEEAKKLTETDPAIKAGSLIMDLKEWYGSAALMQVNETHKKIAEVNI